MDVCRKWDASTDVDRQAIVRAALFRGLDETGIVAVRKGAMLRVLPPKTILFKQADRPTHLHLIVSGVLKLTQVTPAGSQLALSYHGPGDIVGCDAIFGARAHKATAITTEESALISWTAASIEAYGREMPAILRNAIGLICVQGDEMTERVRELATENVEQRIARALGRVSTKVRTRCSGAGSSLPLSRQDLAELTGTTLFTVSRIMTTWERHGVVRSRRERVEIVDEPVLADIVGGRRFFIQRTGRR